VEANWRDTTRKWPEPWSVWSGQLEERDAIITVGKTFVSARVSLWHRRPDDPSGVASWGGAFQATADLRSTLMNLMFNAANQKIGIAVAGKEEAIGFVSTTDLSGQVIFLGTGSYPRPASSEQE
jgi:hypothetical protein